MRLEAAERLFNEIQTKDRLTVEEGTLTALWLIHNDLMRISRAMEQVAYYQEKQTKEVKE